MPPMATSINFLNKENVHETKHVDFKVTWLSKNQCADAYRYLTTLQYAYAMRTWPLSTRIDIDMHMPPEW